MSGRRAWLVAVIASLLVLAGPSARAEALSCVDTETVLVNADRAFIGDLVARDGARLTFDVREVIRGELPDPLVVRDALASSWELPVAIGAEAGLVVYERDGELLVNQCGLVPPARLREARREGWPRGILTPAQRPLVARRTSARMRVGCFGRCSGKVVLRARDGALLGRASAELHHEITAITLRLTPVARRRLARNPRLPVRVVVRLRPARKPVVHRLTLVRGRG